MPRVRLFPRAEPGFVCPHRRRTEQGRRQSHAAGRARRAGGGSGAERGSGGAGGGEARRAGDSGGRRGMRLLPFAHRGLRRPQHGREARRPVSSRAQPAGRLRTARSGRRAMGRAEAARAGGHRRCCCFWVTPVLASGVMPGRYRPATGPQRSGAPTWARVPLAWCKRCPVSSAEGGGQRLPAARRGRGARGDAGFAGGDTAAAT